MIMVSIDFLSSVSTRYIIFFSFLENTAGFNVWVFYHGCHVDVAIYGITIYCDCCGGSEEMIVIRCSVKEAGYQRKMVTTRLRFKYVGY